MIQFSVFDKICSRLMKLKRDALVHTLTTNIQHPFVIHYPQLKNPEFMHKTGR